MKYEDKKVSPSRFACVRWFGFDQFVPERAVTAHWVSTRTFFVIRFVLALYSTIVFWNYMAVEISWGAGPTIFQAFTTLTFVGLHSYLVTACVYHARYLYHKNVDFLLNQPAILSYLYVYLYSTICTFNILTPVVFWSLLAQGNTSAYPLANWLNVSVHGISFFLMIFDVMFNRMKLPVRVVLFPFFTVILYTLMTFIIFATTKNWVYPFLNWSQGPIAAVWYFMVAIITVVAYFIMVLIHFVRDWIAQKTDRAEASTSAVAHEKIEEHDQQHRQVETHQDPQMTKVETSRSAGNNIV